MTDQDCYDIIVAGCGPVGATAANILAARGLSVFVAEQDLTPYSLPRAIHLDHEIMRIFQSTGLAKRLLPHLSIPAGAMHFGGDLGVIRQFQAIVETPRLGWASDYFFYQPDLEAELRAALSERDNVTARFGTAVTSVAQDPKGVTMQFGDETVRGRYLLACDGGRSQLRKALGIELEDLGFDEPWIVVDANVDGPISLPPLHGEPKGVDLRDVMFMIGDPARPTSVIPGVGRHRRWEFMLLPGERAEDFTDGTRVEALLAPYAEGASLEIIRVAVYRFHALLADRWRDRRIFLVGDAAHQTPPFFGQGLCHGIRDAANLAWKLDLSLHAETAGGLLDSYEIERRPQVRHVIEASIRTGRYICTLDPEAAQRRDVEMRAVAQQTAPAYVDLIPALTGGILDMQGDHEPPVGSRFIQPPMQDATGETRLLDDWTTPGTRLVVRAEVTIEGVLPDLAGQPGIELSLIRFGEPDGLHDVSGELSRWFDHHRCVAVLVRPDAYVFGTAKVGSDIVPLVERFAAQVLAPNTR